jgi:co-chaperonin GroES (HSP10)
MTEINELYTPGINMILLEKCEIPSTGGLMLASNPYSCGIVKAIGAKEDKFINVSLSVGQMVYFPTNAGNDISIAEGTFKLVRIQEILLTKKEKNNG